MLQQRKHHTHTQYKEQIQSNLFALGIESNLGCN